MTNLPINAMKSRPRIYPFSRNSIARNSSWSVSAALLALAAALLLTAKPAQAANLLLNPSFEQNSGRNVPTAWTRFAPPTAQVPPNLWIEGNVAPQQGLLYFKEWGACYNGTNNAAGI